MTSTQRHYKNAVILTDFNCDISNAQVEMRFQNVFRYTSSEIIQNGTIAEDVNVCDWTKNNGKTVPPIMTSVSSIPFGNVDYAAHALYTTYRALGSNTRPNMFVHITDPGTKVYDNRSILVTDEDNIIIGPNNGSLGLMAAYFKSRNIPFDLFPIDQRKVEELEQQRMQSPNYQTPRTFHGRDLFAVVAGLIAAGVEPRALAKDADITQAINIHEFGEKVQKIPFQLGKKIEFQCFRDNTFGNLKTNLSASLEDVADLVAKGATFKISKKPISNGVFQKLFKRSFNFPTTHINPEMKEGQPVLYIGSTFSVHWDERFVELAINMKNAGDMMDIPHGKSCTMELERIK